MSKNTFKEPPEEKVVEKPKPARPSRSARRFIRLLNVFGIFDRQQIVAQMPFILFITLLLLFYIGNSYYAERTIRKINSMKNDLKERRAEFISTSSELMFRTKQSEVAKAIASVELKESVEPQKKIIIASSEEEK